MTLRHYLASKIEYVSFVAVSSISLYILLAFSAASSAWTARLPGDNQYARSESLQHLPARPVLKELCRPNLTNLTGPHGRTSEGYLIIKPGSVLTIEGLCFGDGASKVWMRFFAESGYGEEFWLELQIISWSDSRIVATIPGDVSGIRPGKGEIKVGNLNARMNQDVYPFVFIPQYVELIATYRRTVNGGWKGKSIDATALRNAGCFDRRYFAITHISRSHIGNGWSKLYSPYATRACPRQKYHIGMRAAKTGTMTIHYHIVAPRGLLPANIDSFSDYINAGNWNWSFPNSSPTISR